MRAESASEQTKKKKRKKKKKSSSKKSSQVKRILKKSKKKKRRKKKKKPEEEAKSEKTESSKVDNDSDKSTAKKDRFNSAAYADELFNLTGELQASNKELARATRYFTIMNQKSKRLPLSLSHFLLLKISKKNQE